MRNVWFLLWIVLLLLQFITYWLGQRWMTDSEMLEPELLALAQSTNLAWGELLPVDEAYSSTPYSEGIFARESILMELRRQEGELQESGAEVQISTDLEKWYSVREQDLKGSDFTCYLQELCSWLEDMSECFSREELERIGLMPDVASDYPCVVFELSGLPSSMGQRLLRVAEASKRWRIIELDLNRTAAGEPWWMLGSCRYSDGSP